MQITIMKKNIHFSLTAFIKNVWSTSEKVGLFVQKHFWNTILFVGVIAKVADTISCNFVMPLYFYIDIFRDLKELYKAYKMCTKRISLGRGVQLYALKYLII